MKLKRLIAVFCDDAWLKFHIIQKRKRMYIVFQRNCVIIFYSKEISDTTV